MSKTELDVLCSIKYLGHVINDKMTTTFTTLYICAQADTLAPSFFSYSDTMNIILFKSCCKHLTSQMSADVGVNSL